MPDDLSDRVRRWLETDGPTVAPERLVDAALAPGAVTRTRAAWQLAAIAGTAIAAGVAAIALVWGLAGPATPGPASSRAPEACASAACATLPNASLSSQHFEPAVSITTPDSGWILERDLPSVLTFARSDDEWRSVTLIRRPTASVPGGGADEPGIGRTSRQLAEWLTRNPEVDAGPIGSATIAGYSALRVDVFGHPSAAARSAACGLLPLSSYPCVSVLRYQASGRMEELGVLASSRITLYFIDLPDGVLVVDIAAVHLSADQFPAWWQRASALVEALRFEP